MIRAIGHALTGFVLGALWGAILGFMGLFLWEGAGLPSGSPGSSVDRLFAVTVLLALAGGAAFAGWLFLRARSGRDTKTPIFISAAGIVLLFLIASSMWNG